MFRSIWFSDFNLLIAFLAMDQSRTHTGIFKHTKTGSGTSDKKVQVQHNTAGATAFATINSRCNVNQFGFLNSGLWYTKMTIIS